MANGKNPTGYTSRKPATTSRLGPVYFDSTDFSVADDGKVSMSGTGNLENLTQDSGSTTPAAGLLAVVGGEGMTTSGSGSTITIAGEDATITNKGIAAFSTTDFSVTAGTVSLLSTGIKYVEVTVTAAEVKALAATQKTLVAAPGAGNCIEFVSALLKLDYGSEVFTESADNLAIKYTDADGVAVSQAVESTGFIDQAADTYTNALPSADAIVAATGCENQALVLDNTGDGEFGGNASDDSAIIVGISYRVHAL